MRTTRQASVAGEGMRGKIKENMRGNEDREPARAVQGGSPIVRIYNF